MSVAERSPATPLLPSISKRRKHGMSVWEAFRLALQGLLSNKLRSFLTMLGIIIGVASVIVMLALGHGVAEASRKAIAKMGTNVLTILPQSRNRGGVSQGIGNVQNFKLEFVRQLEEMCPSVEKAVGEYRGNGQAKYQNRNTRTNIYGAHPAYFDIRNLPLAEGKYFTEGDVRRRSKVCVLGSTVRETLFGSLEAVGKTIKINGQNFLVIGVTRERGGVMFRNPDDQITVPVTTAMRRLFGSQYLSSISAQAVSEDKMEAAQEEIIAAMTKLMKANPEWGDPVRIFSQAELTESANEQSGFLNMLLFGIALVSLVVGGIGIMNIMLVSVTERTREIGIRKAIGAKRRDILYQFLIESVTLSMVGGLIGIIGAIGVSYWMGLPKTAGGLGLPMMLTTTPMIVSFVFSALIGIFFGIYPAFKASALDPIEALRYE